MRSKTLILIFALWGILHSMSVKASVFELKVKIKNAPDTALLLAHYYGEKQYVDDTAFRTKDGWYIFSADSLIPGGMYIVAGQNKSRYFELLIDKEQKITVEAALPDIPLTMKIKGSIDNERLYSYIQYLAGKQKEVNDLRKTKERLDPKSDSSAIIDKRLGAIDIEVKDYISNFIEKNKTNFAGSFIAAQQEPAIPPTPYKPDGSVDSTKLYLLYKNSFFSNLDLGDSRLLRTPAYHARLNRYFSQLVVQSPDSVMKEVNNLLPIVKRSRDTYRYFVWYITTYSEKSTIMGMDAVFVEMADRFYSTGEMDYWINKTVKANVLKRANTLRPILIGNPAPELMMLDTAMRPVSLHSVKARYTLLLFWDPECGHCKTEIPLVIDFMKKDKNRFNLEVFAVCTDTNMRKMKDYIKEKKMPFINVNGPRAYTPFFKDLYDVFSTPVLYLLDENKKIIAKRLTVDVLESFLERYEAKLRKEK